MICVCVCVCTCQVLSPTVPSKVLGQVSVQVVDERVSVTTLGVHLVSGLSLSLQLNLAGPGTLGATASTRETITQLQQVTFLVTSVIKVLERGSFRYGAPYSMVKIHVTK